MKKTSDLESIVAGLVQRVTSLEEAALACPSADRLRAAREQRARVEAAHALRALPDAEREAAWSAADHSLRSQILAGGDALGLVKGWSPAARDQVLGAIDPVKRARVVLALSPAVPRVRANLSGTLARVETRAREVDQHVADRFAAVGVRLERVAVRLVPGVFSTDSSIYQLDGITLERGLPHVERRDAWLVRLEVDADLAGMVAGGRIEVSDLPDDEAREAHFQRWRAGAEELPTLPSDPAVAEVEVELAPVDAAPETSMESL